MKLMRHELEGVVECVRRDDLDPSFKMLGRISRVQVQLLNVWEVLSTMTPADYSAFRNALGRSWRSESVQLRLVVTGQQACRMIAVHRRDPQHYAALEQALLAPSLYDEVLRLLSRRGWHSPGAAVADFLAGLRAQQAGLEPGWARYATMPKRTGTCRLAERLIDLVTASSCGASST